MMLIVGVMSCDICLPIYSESFGQNVYYMVPSDGKYHYASYSYITGGNHTWEETIYNFN